MQHITIVVTCMYSVTKAVKNTGKFLTTAVTFITSLTVTRLICLYRTTTRSKQLCEMV